MSFFDSSYRGSNWHHGVNCQKWGVRRTPEQLGHRKIKSVSDIDKSDSDAIENLAKPVKIVDGIYQSDKGFTAAVAKLSKFCLNPEKKHSKEFFDVGYTENDADTLFRHIEEGYDLKKKSGARVSERGQDQFVIAMFLGVTKKELFTTAWQIDKDGDPPKMTSAYRDRRNKEE